jgi:hypothetical protein
VIVNRSPGRDRITLEAVSAPGRVTYAENLSGTPADGIVDAEGNLAGPYRSHLGTRGHGLP